MGHHFVPQRYLQNFQILGRPGFIYLHDKRTNVSRPAAIRKVAQTKQFYNAETETILARDIETPANEVIRKLTSETAITRVERLHLAYYIGVMLKRIPSRRRRAAEMIPGVLADVVAEVREQLRAIARNVEADPELLARRLQELDNAKNKLALQPPPEVLDQFREPWPSEELLHALFSMTWRVLVSTGPQYFITTDNPAFFFSAFGLATSDSELSFPLSTTHALHGSWRSTSSNLVFLKVRQAIVRETNRRLVSETERLAFYHEPAPWLLQTLLKKNPYLSSIQW